MRKAVLHIAILLTLLQTTLGHAFISSPAVIQKTAKETSAKSIIDRDTLYKNDIVIDVNTYDEYDFDDHDAVNAKTFFTSHCFFTAALLTSDCTSKTFCNNLYTQVNFSRIPRYDYITLRVLRI